jgi:hypothetical protein
MTDLNRFESQVRCWLKGLSLSLIAVLLEALQDELKSRQRARGAPAQFPTRDLRGLDGSLTHAILARERDERRC